LRSSHRCISLLYFRRKPAHFPSNLYLDCSDAPALSTNQEHAMAGLSISSTNQAAATVNEKESEQWDDAALAATLTRKTATTSSGTTSELMDFKPIDPKRNEHDDIAEKLRIEENKAKLAAAKEGMKREAARLQEEKEKKAEKHAAPTSSRFAAAAAGGAGGKWVPPHMRAGGLPKIRMGAAGGAMSTKVDTQDEQMFPDLAAADNIIKEQEKSQQPVFKVPKKTPVGGGATWASKKPLPKAPSPVKKVEPAPEAAPAPPAPTAPDPAPEKSKTTTEESSAPPVAAKLAGKTTLKKKKKKDLSTFKA